jgi:hypothetical protein
MTFSNKGNKIQLHKEKKTLTHNMLLEYFNKTHTYTHKLRPQSIK